MGRKESAELPRPLEVLWKRAQRGATTPQPALTLERIVAAAIELADSEGLIGLSMGRLAERLGCAPMSIYRHVESKDDLQLVMADVASGALAPRMTLGPRDWRRALERWARALRAVYYRHAWILEVTARHPPLEPGHLAWLDAGLRTLQATSLSPSQRMSVIMLVLHYVRGEAQLAAVRLQGSAKPRLDDREMKVWYGQMLKRLVDRKRLPALMDLATAGAFEPGDQDSNETSDFDFGLDRVLDGVDALVNRRPAAPS